MQQPLLLAEQIASQLRHMYNLAAGSVTGLPAAVQSALLSSRAYADKLYTHISQVKSIDDLTTVALSQIRETMNLFQSSVLYLFQAVPTIRKHGEKLMGTSTGDAMLSPESSHETKPIDRIRQIVSGLR